MGKNKLNSKNPGNSKNPIYKKVGAGAPLKTKSKAKQVKTSLKQVNIGHTVLGTGSWSYIVHTSLSLRLCQKPNGKFI